jgi:preprotein translocase subunit SecA
MADFLIRLHAMFETLQQAIDEEIALRLEGTDTLSAGMIDRGATWTYLTTDEPFGTMTERAMRGIARMARSITHH